MPIEAFSEPGPDRKPVWFEPVDGAPMMFAGIETRGWTSIRKVKDGETDDDLYAFLTSAPNAEVASVHPKAMPVMLMEPTTGPWMDGSTRARSDGALRRVRRGAGGRRAGRSPWPGSGATASKRIELQTALGSGRSAAWSAW
ncbi:SOS response-associated peptidase family protein [Paracoccus mutanolyticus]|uniref:SOS response-associated peptidase family protein n=1 Tax=Paracoccus mutanolyticus TaxID=1499308 RepID=UPI0021D533B2|nr:SOS response-associated peptidase family protein [Paracoccus mutanolyticus]